MTQPVPATVPLNGTAELSAALGHALSGYFGAQRRIAWLERRPSAYRTSFAIEELDVRLEDGTTLELVWKDLSWRALHEGARRAKPAFLYDPLREIETYRTVLTPNALGTATSYGAVVEPRVGRYWLFLEKVPGRELYQVGDFAVWQQVARWLAGMHDRFADHAERMTQAQAARLLRYDAAFYRRWLRRARIFLGQTAASRLAGAGRGVERLADRYEWVVERLVALPATLIHGEFYPSNVLVQKTAGELRVCPVDWEMAAQGPGLVDLAALTAGAWSEQERTTLALAYHAALAPRDDCPPTQDAFLAALDLCRLHLAVQWLGWAPDWSPPLEHAQDWLGEALYLADKLGV